MKKKVVWTRHLIEENTCRRKTKRWPFNCFMFLLDTACQNACSLFALKNKYSKSQIKHLRRDCLQKLGFELITPNVSLRFEKSAFGCVKRPIQNTLKDFLNKVKFLK